MARVGQASLAFFDKGRLLLGASAFFMLYGDSESAGSALGKPGRFAQEEGRGNAGVAAPARAQLWLHKK